MNNLYMYTEGLLNTLFGLVTRIMPNRYIYITQKSVQTLLKCIQINITNIFIYFFPNKGK